MSKRDLLLRYLILILSVLLALTLALQIELGYEVLLLLAVLGLCSLLSVWIGHRNRNNMEKASEQIQAVNEGNLNVRVLLPEGTDNPDLINEINALIDTLQQKTIQNITAERLRKELLSNISHDFRTPLTSIIGYIDALKDNVVTSQEERDEYLAIIHKKAIKLKQLIDELFYMAKLEAGDTALSFEVLDLAECMRECLIEFLPQIETAQIELIAKIPETPCLVYAHPASVTRMAQNLIKNALVHGNESTVIGLRITEHPKHYQCDIWDTGKGISQEDIKHIFERLYRTDKARHVAGGSGLGLYIVKKLVEKQNGHIWVTSEPFKKTQFSFTLPKR